MFSIMLNISFAEQHGRSLLEKQKPVYGLRKSTKTLELHPLHVVHVGGKCYVGCHASIGRLTMEAPVSLERCRRREMFLQILARVDARNRSENYPGINKYGSYLLIREWAG